MMCLLTVKVNIFLDFRKAFPKYIFEYFIPVPVDLFFGDIHHAYIGTPLYSFCTRHFCINPLNSLRCVLYVKVFKPAFFITDF